MSRARMVGLTVVAILAASCSGGGGGSDELTFADAPAAGKTELLFDHSGEEFEDDRARTTGVAAGADHDFYVSYSFTSRDEGRVVHITKDGTTSLVTDRFVPTAVFTIGQHLLVADERTRAIWGRSVTDGPWKVVAETGPDSREEDPGPAQMGIFGVVAMAGELSGNRLYVAGTSLVLETSLLKGSVYPVAGTRFGGKMSTGGAVEFLRELNFAEIQGLAVHPRSGMIYVTDDKEIRQIDPLGTRSGVVARSVDDEQIPLWAGPRPDDDGRGELPAAPQRLAFDPGALTFDVKGHLYVGEEEAMAVHRFDGASSRRVLALPGERHYDGGPGWIEVGLDGDLFVTRRDGRQLAMRNALESEALQ